MFAHRLLGGSSSLSISCPCLGSVLMARLAPISGAPLGGALNPLSSRTPKQWSLASSAGPDFFPDSLPAGCGTLAPFRLCSRASPLPGIRLKPEPQLPAPPAPAVSRQASRTGECRSAPILCVGISPLCPPHPCCCALLCGSEASPSATRSLRPRRGFLVCGNLSSSTAPSHRCRSRPYSFVSVHSFFFYPTQVRGEFLAFREV